MEILLQVGGARQVQSLPCPLDLGDVARIMALRAPLGSSLSLSRCGYPDKAIFPNSLGVDKTA